MTTFSAPSLNTHAATETIYSIDAPSGNATPTDIAGHRAMFDEQRHIDTSQPHYIEFNGWATMKGEDGFEHSEQVHVVHPIAGRRPTEAERQVYIGKILAEFRAVALKMPPLTMKAWNEKQLQGRTARPK